MEIRNMMKGRRAVSKDDINKLMLGVFNPEKSPTFRQDSGIIKAVDQINRELGTNYKINDFINRQEIQAIINKYRNIPLGLSDSERQQFLRTTIEQKALDLEPRLEQQEIRIEDQQGAVPQTPLPNIPMPNVLPVTASVDPTTN